MDNLIQKFYGEDEEQKYTQFGAISSSLLKNSAPNFNFKATIKPKIETINPSIHNLETTTSIPKTPNKLQETAQETFLRPKKLIFNGTSDLFNKSLLSNNLANNNNNDINNINKTQNNIPSLNTIKQNINLESKKNATKMQMMEEKMKNLELKSQRLEVINEFFFDMFENNLVKEELKRQRDKENDEKNEIKEDKENVEEQSVYEEKRKKKKDKKSKKKNLNINIDIDNLNAKKQEELFKKKTKNFANNYLKTVKTNIGLSLVEEQLKKNETLQNMIEDIVDLKGDLINKLERMQMNQDFEMKRIAYCLQNSGDRNIENLANRIFGDHLLKDTNNPSSFNNTRIGDNASVYKPRDSIFNPRESLFNTNIKSRKQSISIAEDKTNNIRRHSLFEKEKNNEDKNTKRQSLLEIIKSRRQSVLDKDNMAGTKSKRQSIKIIPEAEEKNDNEN